MTEGLTEGFLLVTWSADFAEVGHDDVQSMVAEQAGNCIVMDYRKHSNKYCQKHGSFLTH